MFCGAGGLTRGLLDAGITVRKGFDINEKFKETYEKNNEGAEFIAKDVAEVTREDVLQNIDLKDNYLLLAGCAPCQPFSAINKQNSEKDKRKSLLLEFGRLVQQTKPDFIFIENVPGLANGKGRKIFDEFKSGLDALGYHSVYKIVDAKQYGVPQKRKRLILLASTKGIVDFPAPTHGRGEGLAPYRTVREAISKYPVLRDGSFHSEVINHQAGALSPINKERLKLTKKNGGSRKDLPKRLVLKCHLKHRGHHDVYGRMRWDDVAPTLTCRCTHITNGRFGHPTQTRGVSVREAAALQTFSDEYTFYGTFTLNTLMVGNAVPPLLAKKIGAVFSSVASDS